MKKICLLFVIISICTCAISQYDLKIFNKALEENTVEGYEKFLKKNWESIYADTVYSLLMNLEYEGAIQSESIVQKLLFADKYRQKNSLKPYMYNYIDSIYNELVGIYKSRYYEPSSYTNLGLQNWERKFFSENFCITDFTTDIIIGTRICDALKDYSIFYYQYHFVDREGPFDQNDVFEIVKSLKYMNLDHISYVVISIPRGIYDKKIKEEEWNVIRNSILAMTSPIINSYGDNAPKIEVTKSLSYIKVRRE